jgi:succinate dehydrogenase/fumarate reductase flavoprotein subunit
LGFHVENERWRGGEFDVAVAGFGAAGIAAAITAHDEEAEVLVLEKSPAEVAGGNTRVAGSVWFNPTDKELAKTYLRALSGEYPPPAELVDAWADEVSESTRWIEARIVEVGESLERDDRDPYRGPTYAGHTTYAAAQRARVAEELADTAYEFPDLEGHECDDGFHHLGPQMGFSRLWFLLKAAAERRDIQICCDAPVTSLIQGADGTVLGLRARVDGKTADFRARRGTILATGGFENNQEMIRAYLRIPHGLPWGSPWNTGDGIRLAQGVGADLVHMHNYAGVMGIAVPELQQGMAGVPKADGFFLVGPDGRRFMNETILDRHGKAKLRGEYAPHPAQTMFTVFDEETRRSGPIVVPFERHGSGWAKTIDRYVWSDDNQAEIDRGWIRRGEDAHELGAALGLDGAALEATLERYNGAVTRGEDPDFARPGETLKQLKPPLYGYRWGPVVMYTCGGPRKDAEARVLDTTGRAIKGLYCAGEISSTHSWGMSGGQMISDALAFGRIAGRAAARRR